MAERGAQASRKLSRRAAVVLTAAALVALVPVVAGDVSPRLLTAETHRVLAALALGLVALAYLARHGPRPARADLLKAILLAAAFAAWAANQLWPAAAHASQFNDAAVALFSLDALLVVTSPTPGCHTTRQAQSDHPPDSLNDPPPGPSP